MPFELHPRPDSTVEVSAHLAPEAVEEERVKLLKQLGRRVRIPGFRPGKAPLRLVRAHLGDQIQDDLVERLARRLWGEILEGGDLKPISELRVSRAELDEDGTFRLEGVVDVRPSFDLPDPGKITLPEYPVEVTETEIEAQLELLAEEQASWEPEEEGGAEDGMLAEVAVRGEITDDEEAEELDMGEIPLFVGVAPLGPEVDAALQGARPGETRTAEVDFPEDHSDPRLAGHHVRFSLEVRALRRKVFPEIDDDLARTAGADSLEDLKERIRLGLEARKKSERRRAWRRAVLDALEEDLDPAALPPSVVEAALKDALEGAAFSLAMRGVNPSSDDLNWQKIAEDLEPEARRNALDRLVLEQLAEEWELPVPEEDVEAYIRQEAARAGVPVGEYRAKLVAEGRLEGIRRAARLTKVVDRLIEMAGGEED